jgi:hypothetical protein
MVPMPREAVQAKGRRYVTEARLRVIVANDSEIRATCRGQGEVYRLGYDAGSGWFCNCAARGLFSHLVALQLVTTAPWPEAADDEASGRLPFSSTAV